MRNITDLRNEMLRRENGKVQINCAQMSELLAKLSDLYYETEEDFSVLSVNQILETNGKRRAAIKRKAIRIREQNVRRR